ncbi:MAG: hypothetical protein MH472_14035 [Bacteroidia bacterium]|nr:hypothetical protein [Bacteroidia bacterium]
MKLHIEKSRTISQIQAEFQQLFPYLKIEFYKEEHQVGEATSRANTLSGSVVFESVYPHLNSGEITIYPELKVMELETTFSEKFGLSVQVFHKSGNVWLQTTRTDHWTLLEQNKHAEEKEHPIEENRIDAMDRQELE